MRVGQDNQPPFAEKRHRLRLIQQVADIGVRCGKFVEIEIGGGIGDQRLFQQFKPFLHQKGFLPLKNIERFDLPFFHLPHKFVVIDVIVFSGHALYHETREIHEKITHNSGTRKLQRIKERNEFLIRFFL